jgi:alanine racemase
MDITRPTVMEISINNFFYNIDRIKEKCPNSKIMPVIKANAYGTYLNTRLDVLNKFEIVAVACVDEAVQIRELGYKKEIFVLNQPYETEIDKIIKYKIVVGVSSYHFIELLGETNKEVHIHIEIGTGMGRTGVHPYRLEKFIKSIKSNIVVDGVYTHLSSADIDYEYTKKQIESFNVAVDTAKKMLGELKYIHANASNGILNFPEANFNLVRPGIIMYGYKSSEDTLDKIDLKPVASLKSKISFLKEVEEGTSIGYSRSYITDRTTLVATVPIGYADGFRRTFSNGWKVMIDNKLVPIIGKVCMDSFMVDVTDIKGIKLGDEVVLWDNENITLDDLAKKCDTINYEILCTIGVRVPRKFIDNNK